MAMLHRSPTIFPMTWWDRAWSTSCCFMPWTRGPTVRCVSGGQHAAEQRCCSLVIPCGVYCRMDLLMLTYHSHVRPFALLHGRRCCSHVTTHM
jgi:hypothetical protein